MILCIRDGGKKRFLDWSSITDAPTTHGMTRTEALERAAARAVDRAEECGASNGRTAEEVASFNRAGPEETCLTYEALVRIYVRGERPTYVPNATDCLSALRRWEHGEENHDARGNGPLVCVAVDPFGAEGIDVHVTPNLRGSDRCERFTVRADDTPKTVWRKLRDAKRAILEGAES